MTNPIQLGAFELHEPFASGGMGEVWRGVHIHSGVPVAVKVLRRDGAGAHQGDLEREVRAHACLNHPGVVVVLEFAAVTPAAARASDGRLVAGSAYLAMELARGGSLRSRMPLPSWDPIREVTTCVLEALAHAHARGVIHRDIKPENILLADPRSHRAMLADFGIAHAMSAEHQVPSDELSSFSGTPFYIAPEQALGRWRRYGPWTDVYALGCVVWELVCGRPPFGGAAIEVINQHIQGELPIFRPRIQVPDGLLGWLRFAMARAPMSRFTTCADALRALRALRVSPLGGDEAPPDALLDVIPEAPTDALTWRVVDAPNEAPANDPGAPTDGGLIPSLTRPMLATPSRGARPATAPPAVDVAVPDDWRGDAAPGPMPRHRLSGVGLGLLELREPRLIGRERERDALWGALRRVAEGQTRVVSIVGAPGVGKSALARWIATRAEEVGAARRLEAFNTPDAPGPADGFAGMMRRTLRAWGMTGDALYEHVVSRLGDAAQGDDARALTGWLGEDLGDDTERYPPPDLAQRRELVTRLLHAFTRERPALVWIDDAHWSHDLLETLEHVLDHAPERAMLVVVTWRSDLVAADPALSAWLDRVCARPESERVDLGPLTASEEQALVQELLPVDAALAARVSSRAEGNPLFVRQILRWLIDDAEGIDGARARAVGGALPGTIRGLFERRVEDLLDDLGAAREAGAQALEVAAAFGRRVDQVEWDAALEDAGVSAPAHLTDALVRRGLARQTPTGIEFEHALLVDALLERAARLDRLRRHHTHCARALASLSASIEARAREVDHWARAGSWARALEVSGQITRPIARSGNIRALRALLRRRLEWFDAAGTPADDGARLGTLLELGITHSSEGAADALAIAGEVLARARATGQPDLIMKSLELLAMIAEREGRFDHALRHARLAVEAARELARPRAEQIALVRLGWAHVHVGAPAEARAAFDAAASAARAGGDTYLECYARLGQIWVTLTRGARGDARPLIDALVQTAHDHGWPLLEAYGLCHRASAHVVSGDFDLAHAAARAATRASERAGTTAEEALLQSLEGLALVGLGRLDEASACAAGSRTAGAPNQAAYAAVLELAVAASAARAGDFDAAAAWLMGEDAARAVIRPEHPAVATWAARQWRDRDPARASRALAVARALERRLDASPPQTP